MHLDAESRLFRFTLLLLVALSTITVHVPRDTINALQTAFTKSPNCTPSQLKSGTDCCQDCLSMGDLNYNSMYTVFYLFSSVSVFIFGYLLDRFGNWIIILTVIPGFVGSLLMALASSMPHSPVFLPCMFTSNALIGLSFQACLASRGRIVYTWFAGKELGLALGLCATINRLGSLATYAFAETIREAVWLQWTLVIGTGVSLFCLLCTVVVSCLDAYGAQQTGTLESSKKEQKSVKITDVFSFGLPYWMLVGVHTARVSFDSSMQDNINEFIVEKFHLSKSLASISGGAIRYIGLVIAPLAGLIVDLTGRPDICLPITGGLLLLSFSLVAFSPIHPLITVPITGSLSSFQALTVLSSVNRTVPKALIGTAIAFALGFSQAATAVMHVVIGLILGPAKRLPLDEKLHRWKLVMIVTDALVFVSLCFAIAGSYLMPKQQWSEDKVAGETTKYEMVKDEDEDENEDKDRLKKEID